MDRLDFNTDKYPFTGKRKVDIPVIASRKEHLNGYFDGSKNYEQVTGITRGNQYTVVEVEGYGDVFDVTIVNDDGQLQTFASFFFEDFDKDKCVIARHINGITLNDYEYLLEDTGEIKTFPKKEMAIEFLKQQGLAEEDIEYARFFNYQKLQNNIYEEVV